MCKHDTTEDGYCFECGAVWKGSPSLSPKEKVNPNYAQVVALRKQGMHPDEIRQRTGICYQTVQQHIFMAKLKGHTFPEIPRKQRKDKRVLA